jgi:hypothetical protein
MRLTGVVVGGRGKATERVEQLSGSIAPLLGAAPYPGTLNVILRWPIELELNAVRLTTSDRKRAFWPITVAGLPCLAVRFPSCPMHIIEVVSHLHLRSVLGLSDGRGVVLDVPDARRVPLLRMLGWAAVWACRRDYYYTSDRYVALTKRLAAFRKLGVQRITLRPEHENG